MLTKITFLIYKILFISKIKKHKLEEWHCRFFVNLFSGRQLDAMSASAAHALSTKLARIYKTAPFAHNRIRGKDTYVLVLI